MSKTKKVISVVLALTLVMAMAAVAMVSASAATTVYFENSQGWAEVYCYTFVEGASDEGLGKWPGSPATLVEGDIWSMEVPDNCTHIIFNGNGAGQTNNLVNQGGGYIAKLSDGTEVGEYGEIKTVYVWEAYGDVEVTTTEAPVTTTAAATTEAPATTTAAATEAPATTTAAAVVTTVATEPSEAVTTVAATEDETTAATEPSEVVTTVVTEPSEVVTTVATEPSEVVTTVATEPSEAVTTTAAPAEGNGIVVAGTEYTAKAGDTVVYKATLKTPALIEDVQGFVTYDADKLTLTNCDTTNLGDAAIVNTEEAGVVYFNASVVKGLDFTGDISLIEITFTVVEENGAEIALTIEEMTEKDGDSYYTESQKVNDAVVVAETLTVPEEVTTAPTTVPATSTEATTAAATTEAKTTAAATTAEKTDATSKTDAPVDKDVPVTGASVAIYVVIAALAMAAAAVVVLRKKVNG